ncbi:hypothetical protein SUGI_1225120 [Cryptomeria japonica]|uniref:Uncharacterized protein n=1 Tax=Cryptomeria japonica TaxID=3369 RepID=A0AAD3NNW8_CRYJA|nr:hypothetical protein SUGI_1225120 [Cryptomeria japonica]
MEVADPYAVVETKAGAVYQWKANDLKAIGGSGGEAGTGRNSAGYGTGMDIGRGSSETGSMEGYGSRSAAEASSPAVGPTGGCPTGS